MASKDCGTNTDNMKANRPEERNLSRKRSSALEASYSLSSWDKDCNWGGKWLWCAETACCDLFFDEPSGARNHSTLCSAMVHFLADYCKTLRKNNEESAQNKLHETSQDNELNTRLEKRIMRLLTNSATKLVVSVSSTGSELLLSVSEERRGFNRVNVVTLLIWSTSCTTEIRNSDVDSWAALGCTGSKVIWKSQKTCPDSVTTL